MSEPCGDCMKVRPFKCPRHEARRREVSEQPLTAEEAVDKALLYVFQLSDKDYRKMQAAASEAAFIRALEQTGYTVATLDAARAGVPGDEDDTPWTPDGPPEPNRECAYCGEPVYCGSCAEGDYEQSREDAAER